jgi:hypothetical protein
MTNDPLEWLSVALDEEEPTIPDHDVDQDLNFIFSPDDGDTRPTDLPDETQEFDS